MPARYQALRRSTARHRRAEGELPPAELISQIKFLTPAQIAAAKTVLAENWGPMVADA